MAEIDTLLSDSLKRLAQPGDAAGVADAIRSRVDAGDTGTPATSSGFGGGGPLSWLPWVGVVVVAGLVGASLGPLGVFGANVTEVRTADTATLQQDATAYSCIGGAVATILPAGQRVLAVARSEDSTWLGLRDPLNIVSTVWVPFAAVTVDEGQDAAALATGGACPLVETTLAVPQAPVTATPTPVPGPSDTTPPSVGQAYADPTPFYNAETTTVHALATDNVAVTSVLISWSGAHTGSGTMTKIGGEWQFAFSTTDNPTGMMTFELRAVDAAGNVSSPVKVIADHQFFG